MTPPHGSFEQPGGFDRSRSLAVLGEDPFDILVVGGGITGAGVALDAAARGLRTALVERQDFASGTSSKSSKLVHGGLRYLQQHEVALVYENLAERQRLLRNAPHLVKPLPFLIPLFGREGAVNAALARAYSSALWLYDITGGLRIGKLHKRVTRSQALAHLPTLKTDRLVAGFLYFDAQADDARLTLAVHRTAALEHGAVVVNYAAVEDFDKDSRGRLRRARVITAAGDEISIDTRVVVNATGVWADDVRALDEGHHPRSIRPAKGIHVTVSREKLPCDIAAVLPVPGDQRSIFVVPWGSDVYLGTTDTDYDGPLEDPPCDRGDVDYVLDAVNRYVDPSLSHDDVTGSWAGLRPLLVGNGGPARSARTADLSRRHQVNSSPSGMVTVTGGKLTTYRKMAADTVAEVIRLLGHGPHRSPTKRMALIGSQGGRDPDGPGAWATTGRPPAPSDTAEHLASRYGNEAPLVWELTRSDPKLSEPIVPGLPYLGAEVVWAARAEMALTLDDVLARRTRAVLHRREDTLAAAGGVAELLGSELGWDRLRVERQLEEFRRLHSVGTPL